MPPMTDAQRRANWWHYHWHFVLIGAIALAVLCAAVREHVSQVEPDCSVAMVTRFTPLTSELEALQAALEAVCPDVNGDGEVRIGIHVIQIDYTSTDLDDAAVMVMTTNVDKLNADFYTRQSGIFLLDDPANFQANHGALSYLDGTVPAEGAADWEAMTVPWSSCAAVEGLTLTNLDTESLWFARRAVLGAEDRAAFAGAAALWERLFPG